MLGLLYTRPFSPCGQPVLFGDFHMVQGAQIFVFLQFLLQLFLIGNVCGGIHDAKQAPLTVEDGRPDHIQLAFLLCSLNRMNLFSLPNHSHRDHRIKIPLLKVFDWLADHLGWIDPEKLPVAFGAVQGFSFRVRNMDDVEQRAQHIFVIDHWCLTLSFVSLRPSARPLPKRSGSSAGLLRRKTHLF